MSPVRALKEMQMKNVVLLGKKEVSKDHVNTSTGKRFLLPKIIIEASHNDCGNVFMCVYMHEFIQKRET